MMILKVWVMMTSLRSVPTRMPICQWCCRSRSYLVVPQLIEAEAFVGRISQNFYVHAQFTPGNLDLYVYVLLPVLLHLEIWD